VVLVHSAMASDDPQAPCGDDTAPQELLAEDDLHRGSTADAPVSLMVSKLREICEEEAQDEADDADSDARGWASAIVEREDTISCVWSPTTTVERFRTVRTPADDTVQWFSPSVTAVKQMFQAAGDDVRELDMLPPEQAPQQRPRMLQMMPYVDDRGCYGPKQQPPQEQSQEPQQPLSRASSSQQMTSLQALDPKLVGHVDNHQVRQIRHAFSTKALSLLPEVGKAVDPMMVDDPLGIHAVQKAPSKSESAPEIKTRRGAKKKQDIFQDWSKQQDQRIMIDVNVNGVNVQRVNYKMFGDSDPELQRWQHGLSSSVRHDKLTNEERGRAHEDYGQYVADLMQKHGGSAPKHSRSSAEGWHDARGIGTPGVKQLRDLQQMIAPKNKKKKKAVVAEAMGNLGLSLSFGKKAETSEEPAEQPEAAVSETAAFIFSFLEFLLQTFGSLEDAFRKMDVNGNGKMSYSEFSTALKRAGCLKDPKDVQAFWGMVDRAKVGMIGVKEFLGMKPYMAQGLANNCIQLHRRMSSSSFGDMGIEDSEMELSMLEKSILPGSTGTLPTFNGSSSESKRQSLTVKQFNNPKEALATRTFALLVFRNADHWHCGETVLMKRYPTSMIEVLQACGKACTPMVPPAVALLDANLQLVLRVEDIQPQTPYLVKGGECLDPPPSFFTVGRAVGHSFRELSGLRETCRAAHASNPPQPGAQASTFSRSFQTATASSWRSGPSAGSPPWQSLPQLEPPRAGPKWQPKNRLTACMSWSGQAQMGSHHDYNTWLPVLQQKGARRMP